MCLAMHIKNLEGNEGDQGMPPPNMLLWYENYFELKESGFLKSLICFKVEPL